MKLIKTTLIGLSSTLILFLGACGEKEANKNPIQNLFHSSHNHSHGKHNNHDSDNSLKSQVIELGKYHLELLPVHQSQGFHLDFFLQTGDNHQAIDNAQVKAQIQLPNQEEKTLDFSYDEAGKHYAAFLPTTQTGEYNIVILSKINGEQINGRFRFKRDNNVVNNHDHSAHNHSGHDHHNNHNSVVTTKAKLKTDSNIKSNQVVNLDIFVQDLQGNTVTNFDIFQEQLMHLIVVSNDLQFYNHIHPEYNKNGKFSIATQFPKAGTYTLFSDYKPSGESEQVAALKVVVDGNSSPVNYIDTNLAKTFDNTKVELTFDKPTIKAKEDITLIFNLKNAASNLEVTDLEDYLGEKGHLVIVRKSDSITRENYIHAHALPNITDGKVKFATQFPKPGKYKLWGQFKRQGKIITSDFWVEVL